MYTMISSADSKSLTLSFPICVPLVSFCCRIDWASIYRKENVGLRLEPSSTQQGGGAGLRDTWGEGCSDLSVLVLSSFSLCFSMSVWALFTETPRFVRLPRRQQPATEAKKEKKTAWAGCPGLGKFRWAMRDAGSTPVSVRAYVLVCVSSEEIMRVFSTCEQDCAASCSHRAPSKLCCSDIRWFLGQGEKFVSRITLYPLVGLP